MPKLKCEVYQCKYNHDNCCLKQTIDIDGINSKCKSDTRCSSFEYRDTDTYNYEFSSLDKLPEQKTEVFCDVVQCVFERGQKCCADKIVIKNLLNKNAELNNNLITHCHTFESKD